jgi:hypothetical protein
MKTKFIAMAAMAAMFSMGFTACSNNDDEMGGQIAQNRGDAMTFTAYSNPSHVTRGLATVSGNVTTTIPNFMTWAYDDNTDGLYMGASATVGKVVSYNAVADAKLGNWVYSPVQFWPVNALNFVAVAPVTGSAASPVLPAGLTITNTASATNVVTLTAGLTVPTDVENQCDLMFAESDGITKAGADGVADNADDANVPFTFKHALSQIVFKGKFNDQGAITRATIAEITIGGIKKTVSGMTFTSEGTFYGGATKANGTLSEDAVFTLEASDLEGYDFQYATEGTTAFNLTVSDNTTKKNAWFMIPQAITAWDGTSYTAGVPTSGAYIKLAVTLEKDGVVIKNSSDPIYLPLTQPMSSDATPVPLGWDRSKKYIYTIEFNGLNALTPITFSVDAQPWTDADPQPGQISF